MAFSPMILLTNDDGIEAPGLAALYDALAPLGEIHVVAPGAERSAASHSVTIDAHMAYRRVERDGKLWGHGLDGTPADCVKLALTRLLPRRPDLVVAGINPGANIGNNILYSGTVAAAREAAMLGVAAMAVSIGHVHRGEGWHYAVAAQYAARLAPDVMRHGMPAGVLLNVNVPNFPVDAVRGIEVARQGQAMFIDEMDPDGEGGMVRAFRNIGKTLVTGEEASEDTDHRVLERGCVAVTPLHFDLTDHAFCAVLRRRIGQTG